MTNDNYGKLPRRKYVQLFGGIAGAAGLAGCSGNGGSSDGSGSDGSDGSGSDGSDGSSNDGSDGSGSGGTDGPSWQQDMANSLTMWESDSTDWPETIVNNYKEETGSSDLTIERTKLETDDLVQRLQSRLLSGQNAPSAVMVELSIMRGFIDQGGVREITNWVEEAGLQEPIVDAAWGGATGREGGLYAVPTDYGPAPWFYRKDVFDELGIDPTGIESYQELIDAGSELDDDQHLISLPSNLMGKTWRMFYRQTGNKHLTEDNKVNVHSDASVRVVEFFADAIDAGVADPSAGFNTTWFNRFSNGTTPSIVMGAWFEGTLKSSIGESTSGLWRATTLPTFEWADTQARGTVWGGSGYLIPEQSSDAEAKRAFDALTYMTSEEAQRVAAQKGKFPTNTAVYDNEIFSEGVEFFGGQPAREVYAEVAREAPNWVFDSSESAIMTAVREAINNVISDGADPRAEMEAAAEEISERTGYEVA